MDCASFHFSVHSIVSCSTRAWFSLSFFAAFAVSVTAVFLRQKIKDCYTKDNLYQQPVSNQPTWSPVFSEVLMIPLRRSISSLSSRINFTFWSYKTEKKISIKATLSEHRGTGRIFDRLKNLVGHSSITRSWSIFSLCLLETDDPGWGLPFFSGITICPRAEHYLSNPKWRFRFMPYKNVDAYGLQTRPV